MFPATDSMLPIAQVLKSYGTEGEMVITLLPDMPDELDMEEPIFLIFEGLSVPFFIRSFEEKGSSRAKIKLEDIESLEEADALVGQKLMVPQDMLETGGNGFYDLIGYQLFNQEGQLLGDIEEVHDFSGNLCVEVHGDLYPVHDDLILSIDDRKRSLTLKIAAGY